MESEGVIASNEQELCQIPPDAMGAMHAGAHLGAAVPQSYAGVRSINQFRRIINQGKILFRMVSEFKRRADMYTVGYSNPGEGSCVAASER